MARITEASLRAQNNPVLTAILDGEYDWRLLEDIDHAISIHKKVTFRRGTRVKLIGTRNVEIDGKIGTVEKVNSNRVSVLLEDGGGFNVPPAMLEVVS